MRKNKKNIVVIAAFHNHFDVRLFGSGCKKNFLDRQPLGQYTTDNYPYGTGSGPYDQYIFAAYASLRTWQTSVFGYIGAVSIRSDDADKGSTPADASTQLKWTIFRLHLPMG